LPWKIAFSPKIVSSFSLSNSNEIATIPGRW
jgi:hypothetical protein